MENRYTRTQVATYVCHASLTRITTTTLVFMVAKKVLRTYYKNIVHSRTRKCTYSRSRHVFIRHFLRIDNDRICIRLYVPIVPILVHIRVRVRVRKRRVAIPRIFLLEIFYENAMRLVVRTSAYRL